jgi:predicted Zn-dependent protease
MHDKFIAEGAAYDDPELQAYVDKIGQRLAAQSDCRSSSSPSR